MSRVSRPREGTGDNSPLINTFLMLSYLINWIIVGMVALKLHHLGPIRGTIDQCQSRAPIGCAFHFPSAHHNQHEWCVPYQALEHNGNQDSGLAPDAMTAVPFCPLQFEILIRLTISVVSDLPGARFHEGFVHGCRGHSSPSELGNGRLRCCCC